MRSGKVGPGKNSTRSRLEVLQRRGPTPRSLPAGGTLRCTPGQDCAGGDQIGRRARFGGRTSFCGPSRRRKGDWSWAGPSSGPRHSSAFGGAEQRGDRRRNPGRASRARRPSSVGFYHSPSGTGQRRTAAAALGVVAKTAILPIASSLDVDETVSMACSGDEQPALGAGWRTESKAPGLDHALYSPLVATFHRHLRREKSGRSSRDAPLGLRARDDELTTGRCRRLRTGGPILRTDVLATGVKHRRRRVHVGRQENLDAHPAGTVQVQRRGLVLVGRPPRFRQPGHVLGGLVWGLEERGRPVGDHSPYPDRVRFN